MGLSTDRIAHGCACRRLCLVDHRVVGIGITSHAWLAGSRVDPADIIGGRLPVVLLV